VLKKELSKLVEEFNLNYEKYRKEAEANTETKLVEPLFKLLGWNEKDWVKQERTYRGKKLGRADYAFKIQERIVFFLEVKKVGIPLDKEADKQVISYALSKRIPFAVSTNFGQLKIFCVEQEDAIRNVFRAFNKAEDYLENIQDLLFLSKENFEKGLTLKKAESEGRLRKRSSIDKTLLEDLMLVRSLIANDIEKRYPKKYEVNEKDEIVQRILDRLIFIRRCEDTGINPENLYLEEIKHLPGNKAYPKLKEIFSKYNDMYNSGLFAIGVDNDCDTLEIDGGIIQKLMYYLYESKDHGYVYDFNWIDADVLGQVYEQYLGKILSQSKSGKASLKEGQAHRKEQGIYYTPTYIVDYIVKNTVGELLKGKKAKDIKILDPACGSGSFLIKAFDYMHDYISSSEDAKAHKLDRQGIYSVKTEILKKNLYGVDLDNKAVEITKLNLLLKAAEKGRKLPEELDLHVRQGNSLIDDESVAGLNAFKWEEKFKEVIKEGGFDVVIGNPPYVRQEEIMEFKPFFQTKFCDVYSGVADLYVYFFERGLSLLNEQGYFGFIVSNKFIHSKYGTNLRKYLQLNYKILRLIDKFDDKVFADASVDPCIIIIQKEKPKKNHTIYFNDNVKVLQDNLSENSWVFAESKEITIKKKIDSKGRKIKNMLDVNIYFGIKSGLNEAFIIKEDQKEKLIQENKNSSQIIKPLLRGRDIKRWNISWKKLDIIISKIGTDLGEYPAVLKYLESFKSALLKRTDFKPKIMKWYNLRPCDYYNLFQRPKIIYPDISEEVGFSWDEEGYYINDSCHMIIGAKKSWLCILNSKLIKYYIKQIAYSLGEKGIRLKQIFIKEIPIIENTSILDKHTDKMFSLNRRLNELGDKKTDERKKIEEEIKKTDDEIDEIVYKLYGITEEEKNIIEESLK